MNKIKTTNYYYQIKKAMWDKELVIANLIDIGSTLMPQYTLVRWLSVIFDTKLNHLS